MRRQHGLTRVAGLLTVAAATGLWSCGGSVDGPTAPVALPESPALAPAASVTGDAEAGGVSESHFRKITICHKGQTMKVGLAALLGHLRHRDRLGACSAAAACPCFTSEGLADVADQCPVSISASCPQQYSLSLFCAPGGGGGTVGNLGLFEARLGSGTCSTTTQDVMTGEPVTTTLPVTTAQFAACKKAIVGTPFYPASCPQ
jgi:hypothetical protein